MLSKKMTKESNNNLATANYKKTYNFIPLRVVRKVLSFGLIKEIYAIIKNKDKKAINNEISNFDNMKIKS